MSPRLDRRRAGLTLIELMFAITIIVGAIVGLAAFIPKFMNTASKGAIISAASDLAVDRIETIKAYPTYATLEATFNATEAGFATCLACTRTTTIVRDSTTTSDYKIVTVQITGAILVLPVSKSTVIPAF
jgi:Tfp pilus assembly protein PilE